MDVKVHTLASGATVISTSPGHGFRFSDGTEAEPQTKEVCDAIQVDRVFRVVGEVKGMALTAQVHSLGETALSTLRELSQMADLVVVPFLVLATLREQGVREQFPNVVAFNATPETARSAPAEKVVDTNNWSY